MSQEGQVAGSSQTASTGGGSTSPPRKGGGKGLLGCFGCLGAIVILLVVMPVVLVGGAWLMLPTLVSPADSEWSMPDPDPVRTQEVQERVQDSRMQLQDEGRTTLEVSEEELTLILAQGLAEMRGRGTQGSPAEDMELGEEELARTAEGTRGRVQIEGGVVHLDLVMDIPAQATGLPARLRGETTGLRLSFQPRAAGSGLALRVEDARIGRVPVPVNLALGLLRRTSGGQESRFLDPQTGEIWIPVREIGDLPDDARIDGIQADQGRMVLELSRG
jgi:hypothetical protein